jgi:hypothetical protein
MKESINWFKHDHEFRNDERMQALIQKHSLLGYGWFNVILEILRGKRDELFRMELGKSYAKDWLVKQLSDSVRSVTHDDLDVFLEDCCLLDLLQKDGDVYWCPDLSEALQEMVEKGAQKSEAGRKGGKASAASNAARRGVTESLQAMSLDSTSVQPSSSNRVQDQTRPKQNKKIREGESPPTFTEILTYFKSWRSSGLNEACPSPIDHHADEFYSWLHDNPRSDWQNSALKWILNTMRDERASIANGTRIVRTEEYPNGIPQNVPGINPITGAREVVLW